MPERASLPIQAFVFLPISKYLKLQTSLHCLIITRLCEIIVIIRSRELFSIMLRNTILHRFFRFLLTLYKRSYKDLSLLLSSDFISIAGSLIVAYVLANHISQTSFGQYKYILSMAGIAGSFCLNSMSRAILTRVAKAPHLPLTPIFRSYLYWCIPSSLVLLGISIYYYLANDPLFGTSYLVICLLLPLLGALDLQYAYLSGLQKYRQLAFAKNIRTFITTIPIVVIALIVDSPLSLVLTYYTSFLLSSGVTYFFLVHRHQRALNETLEVSQTVKETITYGKHLSLISAFSGVARYIDKIFIFHFFGPIQLAIYTIATTVPEFLNMPTKLLSALAVPLAAQKDHEQLRKILPSRIGVLILINVIVILTYYITSPYIFKIFFPQYMESVSYSWLYALFILLSPFMLIDSVLTAHEKKEAQYISAIIPSFVRIILFAICIPLYGITGAIISILVAKSLTHGLNIVYFVRNKTIFPNNT